DVIEPDERYHHELGRTLLLRLATTPAAQAAASSAARKTLELADELQKKALDEFTQLVKGPEIDLGVAALSIARIEHPDLAPGPALADLEELAARSSVSAVGGRRALDRLSRFL